METTTKTTKRTTKKQPSTPTDPHERLEVYLRTNNVAGIAQMYCHNHIERRYEKEADRVTGEEIMAINTYFEKHPEHVEQFSEYIITFRLLIELNSVVGCVMAEYKLALTQLIQTICQAQLIANDVIEKMATEADALQEKIDALKQGKETPTPNPWDPQKRFADAMKKLDTDGFVDDVIFYRKQYVGVINGYISLSTPENKMDYFIPYAVKNFYFAFKDGRRDIVLESVLDTLKPTPQALKVFNGILEKHVPKMADVEIIPGYDVTVQRTFDLLRDALTRKDINTLL